MECLLPLCIAVEVLHYNQKRLSGQSRSSVERCHNFRRMSASDFVRGLRECAEREWSPEVLRVAVV
jgi:hypothetical protein